MEVLAFLPQKLGMCPFSGYKARDGQSCHKGSVLMGDLELGFMVWCLVTMLGWWAPASLGCCSCASLTALRTDWAHLQVAGRVLPCSSAVTTQQGGLEGRSQLQLEIGVLADSVARAGHYPNSSWPRMHWAKGTLARLVSLCRFPRTLVRPEEQQRMLC